MTIFAVVLRTPNSEVWERLTEAYPNSNHFVLNSTFALISGGDVSENVAQNVGIKGEDRVESASGVVFRMSSAYSGFTTASLWEWLGLHSDELE